VLGAFPTAQEVHGEKEMDKSMGESRKRGMSLESITTCMVAVIVFITVAISMLFFLSVYENSILQGAAISSEQSVIQVSNMVDRYIADMEEIFDVIKGSYKQHDPAGRANMINALMEMRSDVVVVSCYDKNGAMTEYYTGKRQKKSDIMRNLSYELSKEAAGNGIYISQPHAETLLLDEYPWVVSISEKLTAGDGSQCKVVIDILFSKIEDYVNKVGIGQHGYCFIMDAEGNLVYHPHQQLIYMGLKSEDLGKLLQMEDGTMWDNQIIYSIKTLSENDWRIVGISYVDELVKERKMLTTKMLVFIMLIVSAAAVASSYILSQQVSRPIKKLVQAMAEFEKDAAAFNYRAVSGTREIRELSDSFDHMVRQIKELMDKVRREEITLRKTELKALQAQINPHFLYNTLDSIGWLCEEERTQDAVEMVNDLARLFRISISKGHELIPIQKEVEHAKSYLKIQHFRYKNDFSYEFDVEESCLSYYCNKITLQPIIENAICHGLDRMVDEGRIKISIYEKEGDIIFTVEDNGVGMTPEQCRMILQNEPSGQTGIGIKNVNDRIRIYFGEAYGLKIESEPDVGTKVIISMPKIQEGDYEKK